MTKDIKEVEMPKKTNVKMSVIDYESFEPKSCEDKVYSGKEYVGWGENNAYPQYLWELYNNCSTLQSTINGCADFTCGDGIINNTGLTDVNVFGDTIKDVVEKSILDRWIFGGFAIQVKYDEFDGSIISISHIDYRKCRISEDFKYVFVHDKWNRWGSNQYEKFHAFDRKKGKDHGVQIYFYRGVRTRSIYPNPDYSAAIISCETQIKATLFNYNELDNNFASTGIVNFNNGVPEDTEKQEIEAKLNKKHAGAKNAGRIVVSFNEDKEHAATFERMSTDDLPGRYTNLQTESRANIFIALRAHPQLFGLSIPTGFSDMEYEEAFDLLNETHIQRKQNELIKVFDKIFSMKKSIEFKPFALGKDSNAASSFPTEILSDLTVNERRALVGYEPIDDKDANESLLAERLGVGGTQSLVEILKDPEMDIEVKRGSLSVLFGLTDEQIKQMLPV